MTTAELIAEAESISNLYRTEAKFSPLRMVGSLEAVTERLRETEATLKRANDPVLREVSEAASRVLREYYRPASIGGLDAMPLFMANLKQSLDALMKGKQ